MSDAAATIDLPTSGAMSRARGRPDSAPHPPVVLDEHLYVSESGAVVVSARFEQVTDESTFIVLAAALTNAALSRDGEDADARPDGQPQ